MGGAKFTGRVTALDSVVNEATRNVQVQATLANPGGKLRPGMFVQVELTIGARSSCHRASCHRAINYAPYGDSVYVVTDMKEPKGNTYRGVRQQFVKVDGTRGDQVGDRLRRQSGRRGRQLRRFQTAQWRRGSGQQQSPTGKQSGSQA